MPEKPSECEHKRSAVRLKTYADNTKHIVTQCLICGRTLKDHKKSMIKEWQSLFPFEKDLRRDIDIDYQQWWKLKSEVIENVLGDDGRYPEFDNDEFLDKYELENPKPISSGECNHSSTNLTLRKYSDTNVSVVLQCQICGKHIKNIPKKDAPNIDYLPEFDSEIEERQGEELSRWYGEYSSTREKSEDNFYKELLGKISAGEITRTDKTTFGSYYNSGE